MISEYVEDRLKARQLALELSPILQPYLDSNQPIVVMFAIASVISACASGVKSNQAQPQEHFIEEIAKLSKLLLIESRKKNKAKNDN